MRLMVRSYRDSNIHTPTHKFMINIPSRLKHCKSYTIAITSLSISITYCFKNLSTKMVYERYFNVIIIKINIKCCEILLEISLETELSFLENKRLS